MNHDVNNLFIGSYSDNVTIFVLKKKRRKEHKQARQSVK